LEEHNQNKITLIRKFKAGGIQTKLSTIQLRIFFAPHLLSKAHPLPIQTIISRVICIGVKLCISYYGKKYGSRVFEM
jgi:hypothetical protein